MSHNLRDNSNPNNEYSDGYDIYSNSSSYSRKSSQHSSSRKPSYEDYDEKNSHGDREEIYSHSAQARKRKKKRKRPFRRFVTLLIIVLLLIVGLLISYACKIINAVNYQELEGVYKEHYSSRDTALVNSKDVFNILIFGVDDVSDDYGRSDTMLLLSIDTKHKKLKLTSFQRDTFVYVPDPDGDYHTKLTNAFSYGGVGLAMHTIEANYGISIDRYATVNFETFKSIVDVLGGVEVELTDREILYINCQIAQNNQTEYLDAQAGKVNLCGQQALWHIRNRGGDVINGVEFYEGTDWDRTQRQRQFMEAIMSEMRRGSVISALRVADSVAPYVTTNLTKSEMVGLLLKAPKLMKYQVEQCAVPTDGSWGYEENFAGSVIYVYDWQNAQESLQEFIYEN